MSDTEEFSVKDDLAKSINHLEDIKPKATKKSHSATEDEKLEARKARNKQVNKIERKRAIRKFFEDVFSIKTYKDAIQAFEPLLEIVSIDLIFVVMVSSILYLFYIILTFGSEDFNWVFILFKIIGSSVVTLLCYLLQRDWGETEEPEKVEDQ